MPKRLFTAGLIVFLSAVSFAEKKKPDPNPVFPDVTARGRALYECDQAAWHASDAVEATHPSTESIGRYIAHKSDNGWTVGFGHLNDRRDGFLVAYEATQGATLQEFKVAKFDPPHVDTSFYLSAARAIDTALQDFKGEQRPYNVSVLPAPPDQLYVYVVPAQTDPAIYPFGGDVRYLITEDGSAIVAKRQLHKTIIEVAPPKGTPTLASFHTHVLTDVPEDTDVFHVLTRQPPQPEIIGTLNKKVYEISPDGTIHERKM